MMNHHTTQTFPDTITITSNTANQRLDRFLRKYLRQYPDISLVMIFKAIRKGQIKVKQIHAEKAKKVAQSYKLQIDDRIVFHKSFLYLIENKNPITRKPKPKKETIQTSLEDFKSWIFSEDEERLIINKPAGIMIHPGKRSTDQNKPTPHSLHDLIKQYYSSRGFSGSMFQPNVAYRLDRNTSGLVIVAKTFPGLQYLNQIIRERLVDKEYLAIVIGRFPQQLTCNRPLKKIMDPQFNRSKMTVASPDDLSGQEAKTVGYLQSSRSDPVLGTLSLVKVKLFTGRMHQIRIHFASSGFPILGDILYGSPSHNRKLQKKYNILRHMLHCHCYSFASSTGQEVSFQTPLAGDIKKIIGD